MPLRRSVIPEVQALRDLDLPAPIARRFGPFDALCGIERSADLIDRLSRLNIKFNRQAVVAISSRPYVVQ
jgi:hypothetical protein